jgi:hypothetical protein
MQQPICMEPDTVSHILSNGEEWIQKILPVVIWQLFVILWFFGLDLAENP